MASTIDYTSSSSSSDRRGFKWPLPIGKDSALPKPTDRSLLIPSPSGKKKGFASLAFCGLGCAFSSSSKAYAPAAAATERQGMGFGRRTRRDDQEKEERGNRVASDVGCAPGVPFSTEASVNSVVESHHQMTGRGSQGSGRIQRERPCIARRGRREERASAFMDSPPALRTPLDVSELMSSGHFRNLCGYHRFSPDSFEEIMMTGIVLGGGMDLYDRFKDWRLNVDNMSYEELIELGDRIGYVSTGLREEEIFRSLRKTRHSAEIECKCSICQEEYEVNDEMGRLECGHSYHICCIKDWLLQKNACPVCKTAVAKT